MMPVAIFFDIFILLAVFGAVHAAPTRSLKAPSCDLLCETVAANDPEKYLRAEVDSGNKNVCYCRCDGGGTLLHQSVPSSCGVCAELIVDGNTKCYVDSLDYYYETALMLAARQCNSVMVNRFLDLEANPNYSYYPNSDTPVCVAAMQANPNCGGVIKDLVAGGGDICRRCNGKLPIDLAVDPTVQHDILEVGGGDCEKPQ